MWLWKISKKASEQASEQKQKSSLGEGMEKSESLSIAEGSKKYANPVQNTADSFWKKLKN